jgi:serralysin
VERLGFTDVTVAFDIDGAAGQAFRMYDSAFGRTPDRTGLASWIESRDAQTPLVAVAEFFLGSEEFQLRYGSAPDDEAFVRLLYRNVLERAPDDEGRAFWSTVQQGGESRAELLASFSESGEHKAILTGVMQNGIEF